MLRVDSVSHNNELKEYCSDIEPPSNEAFYHYEDKSSMKCDDLAVICLTIPTCKTRNQLKNNSRRSACRRARIKANSKLHEWITACEEGAEPYVLHSDDDIPELLSDDDYTSNNDNDIPELISSKQMKKNKSRSIKRSLSSS